jgi:prolyl-tRNA synthetase
LDGPDGLDAEYRRMYDAYCAIFSRCGLPYVPVQAESGPIGGDASHEFMVPTDAGEDWLVRTEDGTYAANLERAEVAAVEDAGGGSNAPLTEVHTPNASTIDDVSKFLGCKPSDLIKTIVFEADGEPLVALVRGDHEVNEGKLARAAGAQLLRAADAALIEKVTGADVGFAGPVGMEARMIADQAVTVMHDAATGANKTDYHITGVNIGRDFEVKEVADIRTAVEGDRAPNGSPLVFEKCIEVGHVFKLGTKYSDSMEATCLDADGKARSMIMGCYGIGLNRIMAAAIEAFHDDKGICWPVTIAPYQVVICALDMREDQVRNVAQTLHDEMTAAGIEVLLDDRDARPGVKFNDADLIGFPLRVTVGKRGLADGVVELLRRRTGETLKLPPDQITSKIAELLKTMMAEERTERPKNA